MSGVVSAVRRLAGGHPYLHVLPPLLRDLHMLAALYWPTLDSCVMRRRKFPTQLLDDAGAAVSREFRLSIGCYQAESDMKNEVACQVVSLEDYNYCGVAWATMWECQTLLRYFVQLSSTSRCSDVLKLWLAETHNLVPAGGVAAVRDRAVEWLLEHNRESISEGVLSNLTLVIALEVSAAEKPTDSAGRPVSNSSRFCTSASWRFGHLHLRLDPHPRPSRSVTVSTYCEGRGSSSICDEERYALQIELLDDCLDLALARERIAAPVVSYKCIIQVPPFCCSVSPPPLVVLGEVRADRPFCASNVLNDPDVRMCGCAPHVGRGRTVAIAVACGRPLLPHGRCITHLLSQRPANTRGKETNRVEVDGS